jgi:hypothetical protein
MKLSQITRSAILSLAVAAATPLMALNMADGPATAPITTPTAAPTATPAPAPATTQQQTGSLKVTVVAVSGAVQVRSADDQPWQPAKVGMVVDEGAEFRTGPRSSVRCTIPPDQSFTLDRLGTVKVLTALKKGDKLKTDMLMKYGRTNYSVEAAGLEHESTIASPSGTLAVRGTVISLYDQPPYAPAATSYTGQAMFRDAHRQATVGSPNGGTQTITGDANSAAQTALNNSVTDPKYSAGRTAADQAFIASQVSQGGVVSFDNLANITVIRNATPLASDKALVATLPGRLNFVARWFGNSDVNLEVFADLRDPLTALFDPKGFQPTEFLYPGYNLNNSKSGGHIPFDNRGGPTGGTEVAYWLTPPKAAVFGLGALLISGQPVEVKIQAYLDGQKQSIFFIDPQGNFVKTKTLDVTLTSSSLIGGPIIFLPAVPILEDTTPTEGDGNPNPTHRRKHTTVASKTPTPVVANKTPKPVVSAKSVTPPPVPQGMTTPKPGRQ